MRNRLFFTFTVLLAVSALSEHQGARRRWRTKPVREGSRARAPAPVGMAVRGRVLLAQDRQWRTRRMGKPVQERLGAGLPLLSPARDQVPAHGGRACFGGLFRLLTEQSEIDFGGAVCSAPERAAARRASLAPTTTMAGSPASRARAT